MVGPTKTYRIEEIPKEEVTLRDSETLIPVAHFHKVRNVFFINVSGLKDLYFF